MRRHIPQYCGIIPHDPLLNLLDSAFIRNDLADLIFIIPRFHLIDQMIIVPVAFNKNHFSRRKQVSVDDLEQHCPANNKQNFRYRHRQQIYRIYKPPVNDRDLEISQYICKQDGYDLRVDQISIFQIPDLESAICMQEKRQQNPIDQDHDPVSAPVKRHLEYGIVITSDPDCRVQQAQANQHNRCEKQLDQPFILFFCLLVSHDFLSLNPFPFSSAARSPPIPTLTKDTPHTQGCRPYASLIQFTH